MSQVGYGYRSPQFDWNMSATEFGIGEHIITGIMLFRFNSLEYLGIVAPTNCDFPSCRTPARYLIRNDEYKILLCKPHAEHMALKIMDENQEFAFCYLYYGDHLISLEPGIIYKLKRVIYPGRFFVTPGEGTLQIKQVSEIKVSNRVITEKYGSKQEYDALIIEWVRDPPLRDLPKNGLDFNKPYLIIINGSKGCLTGDQQIYTPNGTVRADQVYEGMPILGGYVTNLRSFKDTVYELTLGNGNRKWSTLIANGEHPLWVSKSKIYDKSILQWITVEDIYKAYQRNAKTKSGNSMADPWMTFQYNSRRFEFSTISIGKNLAKLFGYLTSDGVIAQSQSVRFDNTNHSLLEDFTELAIEIGQEMQFTIKSSVNGNGFRLGLTGKQGNRTNMLRSKIQELDIRRGSFGSLQQLEEEELKYFIQGFFNGDGCLYFTPHPNISFYLGLQKQQSYELQFMLWRLGIESQIYERYADNRNEYYRNLYRTHNIGYEVRVSTRKSISILLSFLDDRKYPEKFNKARELCNHNNRQFYRHETADGQWIPISKIRKLPRQQTVYGWSTNPSQEIVCFGGLKTHNTGKSTTLEQFAQHVIDNGGKLIDAYGAVVGESLAILRSPYAQHNKILVLYNPRGIQLQICDNHPSIFSISKDHVCHYTDVNEHSTFAHLPNVRFKDCLRFSIQDMEKFDIVISARPMYSSDQDEIDHVSHIISQIEGRQGFDSAIMLLIREAANVFFSRLATSWSRKRMKGDAISIFRQARHFGTAVGLDTQRIRSLDKEFRDLAEIFIIKRQGKDWLPDEWSWLYSYVDPSKFMRMDNSQSIIVLNDGSVGYMKTPNVLWHKQAGENLLTQFGMKIIKRDELQPYPLQSQVTQPRYRQMFQEQTAS